jgi:phosphate acetyltransferase
MKFLTITERAAAVKALRIDAVGLSPLHRTALKECDKRGWTVKERAGEWKDGLQGAIEAAGKKETDVIFCAADSQLQLVRALNQHITGNHPPLTILHGFEVAAYPKILWVGYSPLIRYENTGDAVKSVQTMIGALMKLGEAEPKVALLSCVETVSAGVPSTVWEAILGQMSRRGQFGKAKVDGPLAFDLAISAHAVKEKNLKSDVGPDADLLVPPDLNSFGTLTDGIHLSGGHEAAMIVLGGPCPLVLSATCGADHVSLSLQTASLLI